MIYEFRTEDPEEAKMLTNAMKYHGILFELKHNFWRNWKHKPPKDYQEVLDKLKEQLEKYEN